MKYHQHSRAGSGLVAAMIVLATIVTLVGVALNLTSTFARQAGRQRTVLHAQSAAESAVEYIYAKWKQNVRANAYAPVGSAVFTLPSSLHPAFATSPATGTGVAPLFAPWPLTMPTVVAYATTDQWGNVTGTATQVKVWNVPGYPGWSGNSTFYRAQASVSGSGINAQGVRRYMQLTLVPLFQAAIFYEDKLEIHPGPPMTITGLVHTNSDLEALAYSTLKFEDNVSYAGSYSETAPGNWSGTGSTSGYSNPTEKPYWQDDLQSDTSAAKQTQLKEVDRMEPLGTRPTQIFDTTDTNTNNDGFREIIERPNTSSTDPPEIATMRLYNKASLKIEVDTSKDPSTAAYLKVSNYNNVNYTTTSTVYQKVKTAIVGTTNMYDQRETTDVKVTSLDMNKFNDVITTMGGNYNGVVYITDTSSDTAKDAIRLVNGRVLNADITIATDEGMYIQGDFNTGGSDVDDVPSNGSTAGASHVATGYTEKSAAVAADAVTILSNNWDDSRAASSLFSRVASNTTINAGMITGNVPTNYNNSGNPSGGVHNLPRFLEMWLDPGKAYKEVNFTYYGSMIQLFQSKMFTGLWYTNNIYWPPNRIWNFDTLFKTNPPKGSVSATQFSRGRWERF
jgi:hypothetical protein